MNAGKSLHLLQVNHNYKTTKRNPLLIKPAVDNRFSKKEITSRLGVSEEALVIDTNDNLFQVVSNEQNIDVVLVDEAQFLTKEQIIQLSDVVDYLHMDVLCYGIKTDAFGNLFEGSKALLEYSDKFNELKQICHCGKKATMHIRYSNGVVVKEGSPIEIGAEDKYVSVCRFHWKEEMQK